MLGLADKASAAGARIVEGVEVHRLRVRRLRRGHHGAHERRATIAVEQVVVAVGPWIASLWEMLGLPDRLDVHQPDGSVDRGPADVDLLVPAGGRDRRRPVDVRHRRRRARPPVLHVDSDQPLRTDDGTRDHRRAVGHLLQARPRVSVQGGAAPIRLGHASSRSTPTRRARVEPGFPDMWCAALSHCLGRFEGVRPQLPPGALGRRRAPSPPTTSRSSTTCAPTSTWPPTPTTATR